MQINKTLVKCRCCYKISRNDLKLGSYHLAESFDLGAVDMDSFDEFYRPAVELLAKIYEYGKELTLNG